jgi:diguanylate cyclase (GGDEF)-like protein
VRKYLLLIAYLLFVGFLVKFLFVYEKNISDIEINDKLKTSTEIAKIYLSDRILNKHLSENTISQKEDMENILYLSKLANILKVEYIYSFKKIDNELYFTSSSAKINELKSKTNISYYFSKYESATNIDKNLFNQKIPVIEESSDKWGTFRSLLIPIKNKYGEINVIGVDIKIDSIRKNLWINVITHTLIIIIITIIILLPLYLFKMNYMKKISHFDILTGLPNRLEFQEKSEYIFTLNKRNKDEFSVLFLDLDGFKSVNDSFGHECGDDLLIEVSKRITRNIRETDIPCRQGGDEFLISLPSTTTKGAMILAEKILESVNSPFHICGNEIHLSFSIGIATWKEGKSESFKELCKDADTAMYQAKSLGKNRIEVFI